MKKYYLFVLINLIIVVAFLFPASAISLSSGNAALNRQFANGEYNGYDYVSFSPVKGEADTQKYPLLVWLHGRGSGNYFRSQLNYYEFSNWASDEYQSRFVQGGCYLLAPRAAKARENSWENAPTKTLKGIIDSYVKENSDNVDTSRIYIAGYSTGGTMVWKMLTAYPSFFAAGVPIAAIQMPTVTELDKLNDTSLWIFSADHDPYKINETSDVMPNFNYLAGITKRPNDLRITSFSEAFYADGSKNTEGFEVSKDAEHFIWESFTYDLFMADGTTPYKCATTIDSEGKVYDFEPGNAIARWLSFQSNEETQDASSKGISKFILFFRRLFAMIRELFSFGRK